MLSISRLMMKSGSVAESGGGKKPTKKARGHPRSVVRSPSAGAGRLTHAPASHAAAATAEFQRREATFKRREEMLKNKDRELQESLIKFNKFLQDNDSKRSRAEKKEKEEIKQRVHKEQEIVKLLEEVHRQKTKQERMQQASRDPCALPTAPPTRRQPRPPSRRSARR